MTKIQELDVARNHKNKEIVYSIITLDIPENLHSGNLQGFPFSQEFPLLYFHSYKCVISKK